MLLYKSAATWIRSAAAALLIGIFLTTGAIGAEKILPTKSEGVAVPPEAPPVQLEAPPVQLEAPPVLPEVPLVHTEAVPVELLAVQSEDQPTEAVIPPAEGVGNLPTASAIAAPLPRAETRPAQAVAHALGGIDGYDYANSIDAMLQSYEKGFRYFETDLILTRDDKVAARHDWGSYIQPSEPESLADSQLSSEEFLDYKIYNQYRPTMLEDILGFMKEHPDTSLILDTKSLDPEEIRDKFSHIVQAAVAVDTSILDRLIPEIYDQDMLDEVEGIYSFSHRIYSPYMTDDLDPLDVVGFMKDNGLTTIDLQTDEVSADLLESLRENGFDFYIYTCNSQEEAKSYVEMGALGIMTDFLDAQLRNE